MDALKKAEQEKKEAAKKRNLGEDTGIHLQESTTGTHSKPSPAAKAESTAENPVAEQAERSLSASMLDLSLEPLEHRQRQLPTANQTREDNEPAADEFVGDEDVTIQADLGDISHGGTELETDQESSHPDQKSKQQNEGRHDLTAEMELTHSQPAPQPDPDQTFHGVDPDKAFSPELYEDTLQGEPFKADDPAKSYDETLPGVPAAQLARDIGSQDQPTPVAAQTIFTATNTIAKPSSGFRWLLISLAVLAVGSAIVFYYYSVTPMSRNIPSPLVARGVETIVSPGAAVNNVTPAPANTPPVEPAAAEITEAATTDTADTVSETAAELSEQPNIAVATEGGDAVAENAEAVADTGTGEPGLEDARLPEVIEPPSSVIRISRSQPALQPGPLVQDGWAAYQAGDYNLARTRYRQAYEQTPENRDVLLGLAAVAARMGNDREALEYYLSLLRLNPMDNVARAALLGFEYGNNTTQSISTLKSMLFESPDQPLLYFNLGKLYASRSSWSEAQQAFFDAYRLDASNPDYALNLAISLDRMRQPDAALDYYQTALALSADTPPGFNPETVRQRIATLKAGN